MIYIWQKYLVILELLANTLLDVSHVPATYAGFDSAWTLDNK